MSCHDEDWYASSANGTLEARVKTEFSTSVEKTLTRWQIFFIERPDSSRCHLIVPVNHFWVIANLCITRLFCDCRAWTITISSILTSTSSSADTTVTFCSAIIPVWPIRPNWTCTDVTWRGLIGFTVTAIKIWTIVWRTFTCSQSWYCTITTCFRTWTPGCPGSPPCIMNFRLSLVFSLM